MRFLLLTNVKDDKHKIIASLILNHFSCETDERKAISKKMWDYIKNGTEGIYLSDNLYAIFNDIITHDELKQFFRLLESNVLLQQLIGDLLTDDTSLKLQEDELDLKAYINYTKRQISPEIITDRIETTRRLAKQRLKELFLHDEVFLQQFLRTNYKTLTALSAKALKTIILSNHAAPLELLQTYASKLKPLVDEHDVEFLLVNRIEDNKHKEFINLFKICSQYYSSAMLQCLKRVTAPNLVNGQAVQNQKLIAKLVLPRNTNELVSLLGKQKDQLQTLCDNLSGEDLARLIASSKDPNTLILTLTNNKNTASLFAQKILDVSVYLFNLLPEQPARGVLKLFSNSYYLVDKTRLSYIQTLRDQFKQLLQKIFSTDVNNQELNKVYALLESKPVRDNLAIDEQLLVAMLNSDYLSPLIQRIICEDEHLWRNFYAMLMGEQKPDVTRASEADFINARIQLNSLANLTSESISRFTNNSFYCYLVASTQLFWDLHLDLTDCDVHDGIQPLAKMHPIFAMKKRHSELVDKISFRKFLINEVFATCESLFEQKQFDKTFIKLFLHLLDPKQMSQFLQERHEQLIANIQKIGLERYKEKIHEEIQGGDIVTSCMQVIVANPYLWQKFQYCLNDTSSYLLGRFLDIPNVAKLVDSQRFAQILTYFDDSVLKDDFKRTILRTPAWGLYMLTLSLAKEEEKLNTNNLVIELLKCEEITEQLTVDHYRSLLQSISNSKIVGFLHEIFKQDSKAVCTLLESKTAVDLSAYKEDILENFKTNALEMSINYAIKLRALENCSQSLLGSKLSIVLENLTLEDQNYVIDFVCNDSQLYETLITNAGNDELIRLFSNVTSLQEKLTAKEACHLITNKFLLKLLSYDDAGVQHFLSNLFKTNPSLLVQLLTHSSLTELTAVDSGLSLLFLENEIKKIINLKAFKPAEFARLLTLNCEELWKSIVQNFYAITDAATLYAELLELLTQAFTYYETHKDDIQLSRVLVIVEDAINNNPRFLEEAINDLGLFEVLIKIHESFPNTVEPLLVTLCKHETMIETILHSAVINEDTAVSRYARRRSTLFYDISSNETKLVRMTPSGIKLLFSLQNEIILLNILNNQRCCAAIMATDYNFTQKDLKMILTLLVENQAPWFIQSPQFATVLSPLRELIESHIDQFQTMQPLLCQIFKNKELRNVLFTNISVKNIHRLLNADKELVELLINDRDEQGEPRIVLKTFLRGVVECNLATFVQYYALKDETLLRIIFAEKTAGQLYEFLKEYSFEDYLAILHYPDLLDPLFADPDCLLQLVSENKIFAKAVFNDLAVLNKSALTDECFYEMFLSTSTAETLEYVLQADNLFSQYYLHKLYSFAPPTIQEEMRLRADQHLIKSNSEQNGLERNEDSLAIQMDPCVEVTSFDDVELFGERIRNATNLEQKENYLEAYNLYVSAITLSCKSKELLYNYEDEAGDCALYFKAISLCMKNGLDEGERIVTDYVSSALPLKAKILPPQLLLADHIFNKMFDLIEDRPTRLAHYLTTVDYKAWSQQSSNLALTKVDVYSRLGLLILELIGAPDVINHNDAMLSLNLLKLAATFYLKDTYSLLLGNRSMRQQVIDLIYTNLKNVSITQDGMLNLLFLCLKAYVSEEDLTSNRVEVDKLIAVINLFSKQDLEQVLASLLDTSFCQGLLLASHKKLLGTLLKCEGFINQLSNQQLLNILHSDNDFAKLCFIYPQLAKRFDEQELACLAKPLVVSNELNNAGLQSEKFLSTKEHTHVPVNECDVSSKPSFTVVTTLLAQQPSNGSSHLTNGTEPPESTVASDITNGSQHAKLDDSNHSVVQNSTSQQRFFQPQIHLIPGLLNSQVNTLIKILSPGKKSYEVVRALNFLVKDKDLKDETIAEYLQQIIKLVTPSNREKITAFLNLDTIKMARREYQQTHPSDIKFSQLIAIEENSRHTNGIN